MQPIAGQYNSTPPTYGSGQVIPAQVDAQGRLLTTGSGGTTDTLIGALTETAPATDTASSGLNGRLQRIAQRITSLIAQLPATLGIKTPALSMSVTSAGLQYETVAAGVTAQVLGGAGATGDYTSHLVVQPTTTAPGVVTLLDNATEVQAWPGGTVGADLVPFTIPVSAFSVSGPWKVTTGSNVKVTAYGNWSA